MFLFLYFFCLVFCFAYFVWQWAEQPKKFKYVIGFFLAVLPVANILLTIIIMNELRLKYWQTL